VAWLHALYEASVKQAQLNLGYAKIRASEAASVANTTVELGNHVQSGQVSFSIVPDIVCITGNFKETQLTDIRPGSARHDPG